jgi:DNA-binding CsgD family transcriptional regulator
MRIPTGRLHRTDALYPTSELVKTEFYNDWLKPNDLFNGFGISLYNDHRFAFLSIVRSRRAGAPSRKELQVLEVLMPHLQRAVQLHEKFATLPAGNAQSADLLDQLPIGIIAIGSDGRALRINAAAEQICRQRDGFGVDRRGFCRLDHLSQQKHLRSLISDAVRTGQRIGFGAGGALSAQRPSMRRPYSILVAPMPSPRFDLGTRAVAAIILISDPDAEIATAPRMLQQLYGLSAAEARLVDALLNGKRFEEAADEFGISLNTAKTQLKSIFRKTDTSRQAELLKLILTGPLRFATPRTGEDEAH